MPQLQQGTRPSTNTSRRRSSKEHSLSETSATYHYREHYVGIVWLAESIIYLS